MRRPSTSRAVTSQGILSVTAVRLVPIAPFTVVNLAAGALGISFRDYLIGTILGIAPGLIAMTLLGDRLLRISNLVEKPKTEDAPSNLSITGRYLLPPEIFDCIERTPPGRGGEIQLTDALRILAQEHGLLALVYEGKSYDAGDKLGFLKATVEMALKNPEFSADFRSYLKSLKL